MLPSLPISTAAGPVEHMGTVGICPYLFLVEALTQIGMRVGTFHPLGPCPFWIRIFQLNSYQKISNFLEVKIDINLIILTLCHAHRVLQKMPLGGAKSCHFFLLA
jgi:hypothetical protein